MPAEALVPDVRPRPSPFEARGACHRAGQSPDPLARASEDVKFCNFRDAVKEEFLLLRRVRRGVFGF
jgi:hypothetical protein